MRPLLMAAWYGHLDAVKMLITAGAEVSAISKVENKSEKKFFFPYYFIAESILLHSFAAIFSSSL